MEAIKNLLKYLLKTPHPEFKYFWILLIIFILAIIAAITTKIYLIKSKDKTLKKLIKKYPSKIIAFAITGLILLFARSQEIMMLSARILLATDIGLLIYFIARPILLYKNQYDTIITQKQAIANKTKYLPKKKKKSKKK